MGLIFALSAQPHPLPDLPYGWDPEVVGIAGHFLEYAILAALTLRALSRSVDPPEARRRAFTMALAITLAYALSDEIHQLFVPGRAFQLFDLAVDTAGALVGLTLFQRLRAG
jgi:VanZ family protein